MLYNWEEYVQPNKDISDGLLDWYIVCRGHNFFTSHTYV